MQCKKMQKKKLINLTTIPEKHFEVSEIYI